MSGSVRQDRPTAREQPAPRAQCGPVGARAALLSQLPLLLLMVLYTTAGLWILSLPIQGGAWVPQ